MDDGKLAKLERIATLYKDGMLTEQEFTEEKRRIIGTSSGVPEINSGTSEVVSPAELYEADKLDMAAPQSNTVQSALESEVLDKAFGASSYHYILKFESIASRAKVTSLDIFDQLDTINSRVQRIPSFNLWGLIFGPLWGCYRRLPAAWIFVIFIAIYGVAEIWFGLSHPSVDRGIVISGAVVFGMLGNSFLLSRYLQQYVKADHVNEVTQKMAPAYWAPVAAIALMLIPPFADELVIFAEQNTQPSSSEESVEGDIADESTRLFDGVRTYDVAYNSDGAILTSGRDTIYLGTSCEANSKQFGKGTWEQANGGIIVRFQSNEVTFGRQEIGITCTSDENSADAEPIVSDPNLARYIGVYPFDTVEGVSWSEHPTVVAGVTNAVADKAILTWIRNPSAGPSGVITQSGGKISASTCEAHNCDRRHWTIMVDPQNGATDVCYFDAEQDDQRSKWFYADGRNELSSKPCSFGD